MMAKTNSIMWGLADMLRGNYDSHDIVDHLSSILIAKLLAKDRSFSDLDDLNRLLYEFYPEFVVKDYFAHSVRKNYEFMHYLNSFTVTNADITALLTMAKSERIIFDTVPNNLLELFRMVTLDKHGRIADLFCQSGTILKAVIQQNKFEGSVHLQSVDALHLKLSFLNVYMIDNNIAMYHGDYRFQDNFVQGDFDFIYLMPPVGQRINDTRGSDTVGQIERALRLLKEDGHLALIVPVGFLFNRRDQPARSWIYHHCRIDGIINISRPFRPYISVDFSLILLRKGNASNYRVFVAKINDLSDASDDAKTIVDYYYDYQQGKIVENDEPLVNTVTVEELGDNFNIARFRPTVLSRYGEISKKYPIVKICEAARVLRSRGRYREEDYLPVAVEGSVRYIRIQDLRDGHVDIKSAKPVLMNRPDDMITEAGDILLSASGTIAKMAIVNAESENCLVSSGIVILRPDQNCLSPDYLYLVMQSRLVQTQIASLTTGACISHLSAEAIKNVEIPLPPLKRQQEMIQGIQNLQDELSSLKAREKDVEEKLKAAIREAFD